MNRHERAAAAVARYHDHVARGLCTRCDRLPVPGTRLCPRHTEMRQTVDQGVRRRQRGVTRYVPRSLPDRDEGTREAEPVPCRHGCCGLPWRRPLEGCPRCGGEYESEPVMTAAEAAEQRDGTWRSGA